MAWFIWVWIWSYSIEMSWVLWSIVVYSPWSLIVKKGTITNVMYWAICDVDLDYYLTSQNILPIVGFILPFLFLNNWLYYDLWSNNDLTQNTTMKSKKNLFSNLKPTNHLCTTSLVAESISTFTALCMLMLTCYSTDNTMVGCWQQFQVVRFNLTRLDCTILITDQQIIDCTSSHWKKFCLKISLSLFKIIF